MDINQTVSLDAEPYSFEFVPSQCALLIIDMQRDFLEPGGFGDMIQEGEDPDEAMGRIQGMIDSMTKKEKADPDVIDPSRRRRIAKGAGVEPQEVNQFLKQFDQVRVLMKQMSQMSLWQRLKMVTNLSQLGAFMPGNEGMIKTKGDTGHRKSAKERAEERKKKRKQEKRGKKK